MAHPRITEVPVSSWGEIHRFLRDGMLYRGQPAEYGDLSTTLERCCDRHHIDLDRRGKVERELMREFRRGYHQYASHAPDRESDIEWLSLMQHHGAPTRLLDFTYSLYVACYFALESAGGDAAVWAIDSNWALSRSSDLFRSAGKPKDAASKLVARLWKASDERILSQLFFVGRNVPLVCPLNSFRLNERLRVQKGVFLAAGTVDRPFMDNLVAMPGHDDSTNVFKIMIPKALATEALHRLFQMNISRTSLFPGLDGYAHALSVFHPIFNPADPLWTVMDAELGDLEF